MREAWACALLKARFEAAGFQIEENRAFAEAGVSFEIDGYDPKRRVGYEYLSEEAGDSWDVDTVVVGKLDAAAAKPALKKTATKPAKATAKPAGKPGAKKPATKPAAKKAAKKR